jgi:hypothetical protein
MSTIQEDAKVQITLGKVDGKPAIRLQAEAMVPWKDTPLMFIDVTEQVPVDQIMGVATHLLGLAAPALTGSGASVIAGLSAFFPNKK